jgi:hypothetical protein
VTYQIFRTSNSGFLESCSRIEKMEEDEEVKVTIDLRQKGSQCGFCAAKANRAGGSGGLVGVHGLLVK